MTGAGPAAPILIADSSCDLPAALLADLGVVGIPFPVVTDGVEELDDFGVTLTPACFYASMRSGAAPTTTQIPLASYIHTFMDCAATGRPIVHVTLSSGLSGTSDIALTARDRVLEEMPDADITVIDSLSASTGLALLIYEAARLLQGGATRDELVDWVIAARSRVGAYFTLDSLETLRRGGRISDVAAAAGTVLDIKPVLRIDGGGRLAVTERVRGRKKSLKALADLMSARAQDPAGNTVVIGHGDAAADAEVLRALIAERHHPREVLVTQTGPVIGSHTGPGMVSLVFWEKPA